MRTFLAAILLLTSLTLSAQSRFAGGASLGLTLSQVSGDNLAGFNRPGVFAGVYGNYGFNNRHWLQLEINFIQKGSYQAPKDNYPHKYSLCLNYVELPVMYKVMPFGKRFVFEIGPTFGMLVSSSEKSELGDIKALSGSGYIPFKKYELAGLVGLNYALKNSFWVNLRFYQSILQVRNHQGNATWWLNQGQYNTNLCISLRYTFQPKTESTTTK